MVEIRRMGPQIGVEVTGVDVKTLDDAGFAPIYQAWLDHNVMVVRDQELTLDEFLRYSRRFGLVVPHPSKSTRHPEVPEITLLGVNKFDADGKLNEAIYRRGAEGWHTDGAYDADLLRSMAFPKLKSPPSPDNMLLRHGSSAFWRLTRHPKRPQPSHDVSNSHFPHLGILSILRQRGVALDHGDQKTGTLVWIQVAANCSFGLSSSQERSYSFLPGKEKPLQALAKLLVHRRHLRCQIEERTTGSNVFGPN